MRTSALILSLAFSSPAWAQTAAPSAPDAATSPAPTVTPPHVLQQVNAAYPAAASGVTGTVVLEVTVSANGGVENINVVQSVDPALDAAALEAMRGWSFAPARKDGVAVAARIRIPFAFASPTPQPPAPAATSSVPTDPAAANPATTTPAPANSAAANSPAVNSASPPPGANEQTAPSPQAPPQPAAPPPPVNLPATDSAEPASPESTVTVSGERAATAQRRAGDFAVQRDVLESAPRHEGVEVLRSAPGLYIARSEGAAVAHRYMLRGFDSEHGQDIEFKVAGLPINQPSHIHGQGYADLGFLIAETVDEVRVTEGVHDPRQGDFAVAGSLDVQLGVRERGLLSRTAYGSFGSFRQLLLWAPQDQLRDSFAAVALQHTDGFGQNRRGQSVSAVAQQGYSLDRWRLRGVGIFYGARAAMAGVLRKDDIDSGQNSFYDVYPYPTAMAQNALSGKALVGLFGNYRGDEGDSAEIGVWASDDDFRVQENFTGFTQRSETLANVAGRGDLIEQTNRARAIGFQSRYRTPLQAVARWLDGYVEFGLSARLDDIQQAQNLIDASVRNQTWDQRIDAKVRASDVGAFADLDLHLAETWKVRLGARADALSYSIEDALGNRAPATRPDDSFIVGFRRSAFGIVAGPRASSDWDALDWLTVHASYGEGYRSPAARLLDDGEQAPFAKVRSSDVGVRLHSTERYELAASLYHTTLSDDVAFEADEGRLERIGATRRVGAVVHAEARPWDGFVSAGSVTYVDAELLEPPPATPEEPDPPFRAGQNLPFVPPLVARLDLGYQHALGLSVASEPLYGRVGAGASVLTARPLPYGTFADPLALLDLSVGIGLAHVEFGFEVFNLLDSRYAAVEYSFVSNWDPDASPSRVAARHYAAGPPRTLLATVELRL